MFCSPHPYLLLEREGTSKWVRVVQTRAIRFVLVRELCSRLYTGELGNNRHVFHAKLSVEFVSRGRLRHACGGRLRDLSVRRFNLAAVSRAQFFGPVGF